MSPFTFDVLSHMNHFVYDGPYEVTNGLVWADAYGKVIRMLLRQALSAVIGKFLYGQEDLSGDDGGDSES